MPTADPDDTVQIEPEKCSSCGADLAEGTDAGTSWAQVWDILPVVLQKLHYVLTQRRCSCAEGDHGDAAARAGGRAEHSARLLGEVRRSVHSVAGREHPCRPVWCWLSASVDF